MAALGYARAPPRGGAMADARTVQAQDAQEPRAMSGWIIAIALSVLTGAAILRFGRLPCSAGEPVASQLPVALAGFASQGYPPLACAPRRSDELRMGNKGVRRY